MSVTRKFTRLYKDDTIKTLGSKVLLKLTTEEPQESIVGTWKLNSTIYSYDGNSETVVKLKINTSFNGIDYGVQMLLYGGNYKVNGMPTSTVMAIVKASTTGLQYYESRSRDSSSGRIVVLEDGEFSYYEVGTNEYNNHIVFTITGGEDVENEALITWLKANATKQEPKDQVLGFTGLTNSSGDLVWTDDAAGLSPYSKSTSGALLIDQ